MVLTARVCQGSTAGPPLSFTHVNCFQDQSNARALDGPVANLGANGNSPVNCAQACSNLGFPLAGVENGKYVLTQNPKSCDVHTDNRA
jgi:hypothetical protein